jgi:hypothetical protein
MSLIDTLKTFHRIGNGVLAFKCKSTGLVIFGCRLHCSKAPSTSSGSPFPILETIRPLQATDSSSESILFVTTNFLSVYALSLNSTVSISIVAIRMCCEISS